MCVPALLSGIHSDLSSGTSSPLCDSGLHLNYHPNNTVLFSLDSSQTHSNNCPPGSMQQPSQCPKVVSMQLPLPACTSARTTVVTAGQHKLYTHNGFEICCWLCFALLQDTLSCSSWPTSPGLRWEKRWVDLRLIPLLHSRLSRYNPGSDSCRWVTGCHLSSLGFRAGVSLQMFSGLNLFYFLYSVESNVQ